MAFPYWVGHSYIAGVVRISPYGQFEDPRTMREGLQETPLSVLTQKLM